MHFLLPFLTVSSSLSTMPTCFSPQLSCPFSELFISNYPVTSNESQLCLVPMLKNHCSPAGWVDCSELDFPSLDSVNLESLPNSFPCGYHCWGWHSSEAFTLWEISLQIIKQDELPCSSCAWVASRSLLINSLYFLKNEALIPQANPNIGIQLFNTFAMFGRLVSFGLGINTAA